VDDLLFTSKIRTAAAKLGVPVTFARSGAAALESMRQSRPSAVIFDLDSARLDPLATLAAMRGDPDLDAIPTVGFVSHVHVDVVDAARRAGIGEVMARSAFTNRLAEILTR
jgi:CheY-like chemotaxis protein